MDIDYSNPNPNTWVPIYSSGQNISYFYSDTGAKEVKLTVTDIHGCKDTDTVVVNIYPLPVVDFYADTVWGCDTLSVSFYDRSQTIDTSTYYWDLGNSQTSTDSIALAYYSQTGVYDVSLTVTNPYGCYIKALMRHLILRRPQRLTWVRQLTFLMRLLMQLAGAGILETPYLQVFLMNKTPLIYILIPVICM